MMNLLEQYRALHSIAHKNRQRYSLMSFGHLGMSRQQLIKEIDQDFSVLKYLVKDKNKSKHSDIDYLHHKVMANLNGTLSDKKLHEELVWFAQKYTLIVPELNMGYQSNRVPPKLPNLLNFFGGRR